MMQTNHPFKVNETYRHKVIDLYMYKTNDGVQKTFVSKSDGVKYYLFKMLLDNEVEVELRCKSPEACFKKGEFAEFTVINVNSFGATVEAISGNFPRETANVSKKFNRQDAAHMALQVASTLAISKIGKKSSELSSSDVLDFADVLYDWIEKKAIDWRAD